ncbi:MAG: TlpA family protein disulfide reductase [Muribaculaceae bacterium]|nr:TlpA family protein disulfide reductase [Muribaculaceae bacterium]
MKKFLFALGTASLLLAACTSGSKSSDDDDARTNGKYTINFKVPQELTGKEILLVSIDGKDTLATAVASDTIASLSGKIQDPTFCILQIDGLPLYNVVVEPGEISFNNDNNAVGTKSNDVFADYIAQTDKIADKLEEAADEEAWDKVYYGEIIPGALKFVKENPNNPYNQAVFQQFAMDLDAEQIKIFCDNDSTIKANPAVKKLMENAEKRQSLQVGKPYANVEIPLPDGSSRKLSEWITPGRFTIIDFWASWCNPCRQEIPGLVEIYKQYKNAGIDVLGIAVWDEVADTEAAIKQDGIPYPVIAIPKDKSQAITDAYGINGIPSILMIDPQGNIFARDLRGAAIQEAVDKALISKRR